MHSYENLRLELEYGKHHLIIDGAAGSAKTTVIREFMANTSRSVVACATTGLAASHIDSLTIHSLFQFPPSLIIPGQVETGFSLRHRLLRKVDTLIVDEVSMLVCSTLDGIDQQLQEIRDNSQPFGGVRMIFVGDHYQLGPVVKETDRPYLEALSQFYRYPFYYFAATVFQRGAFLDQLQMFWLNGNFRHKGDPLFKMVLDRLRSGVPEDLDINVINARTGMIFGAKGPAVCLTNNEVDAVNKIHTLTSPNKTWIVLPTPAEVMVSTDLAVREHPAIEPVYLLEGAKVMCTANGDGYFNGSIGTVAKIDTSDGNNVASVSVLLESGAQVEIVRQNFEVLRPYFNEQHGRVEVHSVTCIQNFPLRLAYAFTVHKAQGMTMDSVILCKERKADFPGQMYTAISRVRSLNNLYLTAPVTASDFFVDPEISRFMTRMLPLLKKA